MYLVPKESLSVIGGVLLLATNSSHHARLPLGLLLSRWKVPFQKNNFNYLETTRNTNGEVGPIQFIAWEFVSEEWALQFAKDKSTVEYYGQSIEEGDYMFILDVVSPEMNPFKLIATAITEVRKGRLLKGIVYRRNSESSSKVYCIKIPNRGGNK